MSKLKMTIQPGRGIDVLRVTVSKINEPQSPLWEKWFQVKKKIIRKKHFFGLLKKISLEVTPINVCISDLEYGRYYVRYFDCSDDGDLGNLMKEYVVQTKIEEL